MEWLCLPVRIPLIEAVLPFYAWFFYLILASGIVLFTLWIFKRYRKSYRTAWYKPRPCHWGKELTWDDVSLILLNEPLRHQKTVRGAHIGIIVFDLIKALFILLTLAVTIDFIPKAMEKACINNPEANAESQTFIIYVIGGITLLLTFLIAFMKIQAEVKSSNRQKWIDQVRENLEIVIDHMPFPHDKLDDGEIDKKRNKAKPARMQLELLLNPSEKDHRTLSYLLRKAYAIEDLPLDHELRQRKELSYLLKLRPTLRKRDYDTLLSLVIRLSNAIFKREWERIKRGK